MLSSTGSLVVCVCDLLLLDDDLLAFSEKIVINLDVVNDDVECGEVDVETTVDIVVVGFSANNAKI
jgi:hypothetical protein